MTRYLLLCSIIVAVEGEEEKQLEERGEKGEEGMLSQSAMMTSQSSVLLILLAMIRIWWRLWRGTSYKPTLMSNGGGKNLSISTCS